MERRNIDTEALTLLAQARGAARALDYRELRCDECDGSACTRRAVRAGDAFPCRRCDELGLLWVSQAIADPQWYECVSATELLARRTLELFVAELA
ncbi:MAG TPA: hypothetical protein VGK30_14655 [Candidatus Binatia bacterium]|jgi:hypothetical protein